MTTTSTINDAPRRQDFIAAERAFIEASGLPVAQSTEAPPPQVGIQALDIFKFETGAFYQVTRTSSDGRHVHARAIETVGGKPNPCRFLEHSSEEKMIAWAGDQIACLDRRAWRLATRVYTRAQTLATLFRITSRAKAQKQIL